MGLKPQAEAVLSEIRYVKLLTTTQTSSLRLPARRQRLATSPFGESREATASKFIASEAAANGVEKSANAAVVMSSVGTTAVSPASSFSGERDCSGCCSAKCGVVTVMCAAEHNRHLQSPSRVASRDTRPKPFASTARCAVPSRTARQPRCHQHQHPLVVVPRPPDR